MSGDARAGSDGRRVGALGVQPAGHEPLPGRWATFVVERFPLASYGPLIVALVLCGTAAAAVASGQPFGISWRTGLVAVAVACALLQLRALDELHDADVDRVGRPERPLPRGLVTPTELRALAATTAVVGVALAAPLGPVPVAWYAMAVSATWLLKQGRADRLLPRRGMLADALLHSIIVPLLLVFAWAAVAMPVAEAPLAAAITIVWSAGLGMEIARKTVLPAEERPAVDTYSGAIGRPVALAIAALALSCAYLGAGLLAVAVNARMAVTLPPLAVAAAVIVLARSARRMRTAGIRAVASILVMGALLWPVVIAWAG